jgi:hypothetical protein
LSRFDDRHNAERQATEQGDQNRPDQVVVGWDSVTGWGRNSPTLRRRRRWIIPRRWARWLFSHLRIPLRDLFAGYGAPHHTGVGSQPRALPEIACRFAAARGSRTVVEPASGQIQFATRSNLPNGRPAIAATLINEQPGAAVTPAVRGTVRTAGSAPPTMPSPPPTSPVLPSDAAANSRSAGRPAARTPRPHMSTPARPAPPGPPR